MAEERISAKKALSAAANQLSRQIGGAGSQSQEKLAYLRIGSETFYTASGYVEENASITVMQVATMTEGVLVAARVASMKRPALMLNEESALIHDEARKLATYINSCKP